MSRPWGGVCVLIRVKANELLFWVGGVEATDTVSGLAIFAAREVSVLSFVPLEFDPNAAEEFVEVAQDVVLAALV